MSSVPDDTDLATLLRDVLAQLGLRQVDLCKRTGLSAKHVCKIAGGTASITTQTALLFERATDVPASTWMRAQAVSEERLLRRRPRVWWSGSLGVIEQMIYAGDPVRYLRVTTNTLLEDLPQDAVELCPPKRRRAPAKRGEPVSAPPELVDEVAERLRSCKLRFGPSTLSLLKDGATSTCMTGGERQYLAMVALGVVVEVLVAKGATLPWRQE